MDYVLSQQTADRLKILLSQQPGETGSGKGGRQAQRVVLVRCTDDTAAGADEPGSLCYPGVVLDPANDDDSTGPEELGTVWLTVWGTSGAETPTVDQVYSCTLSGDLDIDGDERPRAHAGTPSSGGSGSISYGTEATGSASLTSNGVAYEATTASISLPEAGTYLVFGKVSARAWTNLAPAYIYARLYNVTDSSAIANTNTVVLTCNNTTSPVFGNALLYCIIAITGAKTIRIEAARDNGGSTWIYSTINDGGNETTAINYLKIG